MLVSSQVGAAATEIETSLECPKQSDLMCKCSFGVHASELKVNAVNREKLPRRGDPSESEKIFRAGK